MEKDIRTKRIYVGPVPLDESDCFVKEMPTRDLLAVVGNMNITDVYPDHSLAISISCTHRYSLDESLKEEFERVNWHRSSLARKSKTEEGCFMPYHPKALNRIK